MKITVIGIGYVGIHSVVNLAESKKKYFVVGFDINENKIKKIKAGIDVTNEVGSLKIKKINKNPKVKLTSDVEDIKNSDIYIVAVPTDADINGEININPLLSASKTIAAVMKKKSIIIYESTVYPGLTEEICIPILESETGLKVKTDFSVVYTPERVDPGNQVHTVQNTPRIISGTDEKAIEVVINIYEEYIEKMIKVSTIKVAESVKILENTQRDINIALMNNFALLMHKMDINYSEVLDAASTKWNFLNFQPGLVGGHCIGVDPYYLIKKMNYEDVNSEFIKTARVVNENLLEYLTNKILSKNPQKILYIGCTFKPNTNDTRNSKHIEIINILKDKSKIDIFDPKADMDCIKSFSQLNKINEYDTIVIGVIHEKFDYSELKKINFEKINVYNFVNKFKLTENQWNLM